MFPYKIEDIDYFLISMSKCGSTSMYNALRRVRPHNTIIGFHSDHTLDRLYGDNVVTAEYLIRERKKVSSPFFILLPFREPIGRKISQYYQYANYGSKSFGKIVEDIRNLCLGDFSLFHLGEQSEMRVSPLFKLPPSFDKELGYNHTIEDGMVNIIRYTLESITDVEKYLKKIFCTPLFSIEKDKVTEDVANYFDVRKSLDFSEEELNKIYGGLCQYYYTEKQIEKFKERYRR